MKFREFRHQQKYQRKAAYTRPQTERMVTVLKGRLEKGMPNFDASKMTNDNIATFRWRD